jgi:hypothetical protein
MRKFVVGVTVRGRLKGKGSGYTRVSAEQSTPRHRFIHSFIHSFIYGVGCCWFVQMRPTTRLAGTDWLAEVSQLQLNC